MASRHARAKSPRALIEAGASPRLTKVQTFERSRGGSDPSPAIRGSQSHASTQADVAFACRQSRAVAFWTVSSPTSANRRAYLAQGRASEGSLDTSDGPLPIP